MLAVPAAVAHIVAAGMPEQIHFWVVTDNLQNLAF